MKRQGEETDFCCSPWARFPGLKLTIS